MREFPAHEEMATESLLGQAADEFTQRCARGERPDIEEYATRYPQIAAVIREVFPALQVMPSLAREAEQPEDRLAVELPATGVLGDYRLVRELGRGGMGIVYEAMQISLGRRVALKILPFAAVLDPKQLGRFKNEALAAAQLHHTNIVPVFAVGCERSVHFYAMQYIEGQSLSAIIGELRQLAGLDDLDQGSERQRNLDETPQPLVAGPSAEAGVRTRETASDLLRTISGDGKTRSSEYIRSVANLGVQAAEALQHAHEQGVIHRDIKPSNLLLDTAGRLWITDFGLAVMQAETALTVTGDLLGTLRYMSPEQALAKRGLLDHRTDIYSLGVTLYELLTLEPAYKGRDRQELLRQIALEEPRRLRQVSRAIPAELEIVLGKAMAKIPSERYATAQELADDLRRFLHDKPILAKPPNLLDRATKWSRRHRPVVMAGVVLLIATLAGLSVSTILIARERAKALRERDVAREQRHVAETNLQLAHEVVGRMLAIPSVANRTEGLKAETLKLTFQRDALEKAKLLAESSHDVSASANLANAYLRLGQTHAALGQDESAEQNYRAANRILKDLRANAPAAAQHVIELAQADLLLGSLLWEKRRYPEAEALAREAHGALMSLAGQDVAARAIQQQLAASLDLLGVVLRDTGRFDESEKSLRESTAVWQALINRSLHVAENPDVLELARTERNLADLLLKTGRRQEAEATIVGAIARLEQLANWFPHNSVYPAELSRTRRWWNESVRLADRQIATASVGVPIMPPRASWQPASGYSDMFTKRHQTLEDALNAADGSDEVTADYRETINLVSSFAQTYPNEARYREDMLEVHRLEALRMRHLWRLAESQAAYREAIALAQQLAAEFPNDPGSANRLAEMQRQFREACNVEPVEQMMRLSKGSPDEVAQAIELARNIEDGKIDREPMLLNICATHMTVGADYIRAEHLARKAIEKNPDYTGAWNNLGWACLGLGRREEAEAAFRKTLAISDIRTADEVVSACPEPSMAAFFLDLASPDQYVSRWQGVILNGSRLDSWAWFFVGVRMELDGRLDEAESAYRTSASFAEYPNPHVTAKWAAYRLRVLTAPQMSPR